MTTVRAALIQAFANLPKEEVVEKHVELIKRAADAGAQVACLQELFFGPYFPAEQNPKWFATAEPDDGPTITRMRELARAHNMVLVVPFFEEAQARRVYYNSAVIIESDGSIVGKYRKTHIPHTRPCFWEKFFFKPGNLGFPVFNTSVGRIGLLICYDRHFPEGARAIGLKAAEIVFVPSATVGSLSDSLWQMECAAHAVANGFWVGAVNRVGIEEPLSSVEFFGSSYFCDPRGQVIAQASATEDDVLVADIDLNKIKEVLKVWQFFRDRRPEIYAELTAPNP